LRHTFFSRLRHLPRSPLLPYTTSFRSRVKPDPRRRLAVGPIDDRDPADPGAAQGKREGAARLASADDRDVVVDRSAIGRRALRRSEEHTSELQSRVDLVCRLLLEKKNT